ncbi:MAG: PilT/PilU family type 4a pilus ATPase, partial [Patescibacteria group bacterium]
MTNSNIQQLLELTARNKASDLHILPGVPPMMRVNGELSAASVNGQIVTAETSKTLLSTILTEKQKEVLLADKELDFSYSLSDGTRFRVNVYFAQGALAAAFRIISEKVPTIEELKLPESLKQFATLKQGFVLVTGPTGHGKSSTVAAILNEINQNRNEHIITVEDPIEFLIKPIKSMISQREIGSDSLSWANALRSCLREDPNVVFIGEMRDLETVAAAMTIAETGHLVFSTLHTNSAAQTIDRIIDVFPEGAKGQARSQLAAVLSAVISQRLIPTVENSRVPAIELLISNNAVKTSIREAKTH